jgi:hypothetical protein
MCGLVHWRSFVLVGRLRAVSIRPDRYDAVESVWLHDASRRCTASLGIAQPLCLMRRGSRNDCACA